MNQFTHKPTSVADSLIAISQSDNPPMTSEEVHRYLTTSDDVAYSTDALYRGAMAMLSDSPEFDAVRDALSKL